MIPYGFLERIDSGVARPARSNSRNVVIGSTTNFNDVENIKMKKIIAVAVTALMVLGTSPAQAETGYRYWSFWLNNNGWEMAQEGAGTLIPKDGDIQGWRYITSPSNTTLEYAPRSSKSFNEICGDYPAEPESVRVALIIDFGNPEDYPKDTQIPETYEYCSIIKAGDSSMALLQGLDIRENGGMICALDALPATGCGEEVDIAAPVVEKNTDKLPYITMSILGIFLILLLLANRKKNSENRP